jgi:hypothetical protein
MKKIILMIAFFSSLLLMAETRILEKSEDRIILQFDFTDLVIREDADFSYFSFSDWESSEISGAPDLPQRVIKIIIPENGQLVTSILSLESEVKNLFKPPVPVPSITGFKKTNRFDFNIDEELYKSQHRNFYEAGLPVHYRYYDYVPLKLTPVKLITNEEVEICKKLTLQIDITGTKSETIFSADPFEKFYQEIFLNYDQAKYWRSKKMTSIDKIPFERSGFWYELELEGAGVYHLTEDQLSLLPEFYDPASLRLLTLNKELNNNSAIGYQYKLQEIPLYIEPGSVEVLFQIEQRRTAVPGNSSGHKYWLCFGGEFAEEPLRTDLSQMRSEVEEVYSFQKYEKNHNFRNRSVNCIYISPQEFLEQTSDLAQFHADNYGLASIITDQQDIFDQYSSGDADPLALRNYIYDTWQNLPENEELKYVMLIGSGTSEWLNPTEKNRIITYNDSDDNFVIFTASYAELIISRIPAQNESQLDFYLDRLRTYVEEPVIGWWRNKMVLIADDENKDGDVEGFTGGGLDHTNLAQETQDLLNEGFFVDKVLGLEYNFDEYNNKPEARDALISKINDGCLIWYFIGHGNPDVLGDEDYFRGSQHLRLLDNLPYLPLFLAASCSVGEFDSPAFDCIAERLLFLENGGSIASLAASGLCSGSANTDIMKGLLRKLINERFSLGDALYYAKLFTGQVATAKKYNLLGDAVIDVLPPIDTGYIANIPDSIKARQLININADLDSNDQINSEGLLRVFDSEYDVFYSNTLNDHTYEVTYSRNGSIYYKGGVEILNDEFSSTFIVPDDIRFGDRGKMINYSYDEVSGQDYITYESDISYSSVPADSTSNDLPEVSLWLDSRSFLSGDYVSTSPLLIAEIEDSNGINILGSAGHRILVLLDEESDPIDVTDNFIYYTGSYTTGELQYPLPDLQEGFHYLRLIVFDNFNNPTVAETEFKVRSSGSLSIEQMLVYPNPINTDGYFTFIITESAEVTISIFTITGRKIRTLKKVHCDSGYNQIYWDGKDGDGDRIANNTYFYKIKAKQAENGKIAEKIGKLIILK